MWIPQCAQCFLHFWRYNNFSWKPVCHWDFDILMWLVPSWCDFLPTRCYMGLMWLLPNWCDLNPSLVALSISHQMSPLQSNTGWWFGTFFLFFHVLGIIIPTDFHIFQRGRSTTNQNTIMNIFGWHQLSHQEEPELWIMVVTPRTDAVMAIYPCWGFVHLFGGHAIQYHPIHLILSTNFFWVRICVLIPTGVFNIRA